MTECNAGWEYDYTTMFPTIASEVREAVTNFTQKSSEDTMGNFSVGLGLQARSPRVDHEPAVLDRERLRLLDMGHHERQVE